MRKMSTPLAWASITGTFWKGEEGVPLPVTGPFETGSKPLVITALRGAAPFIRRRLCWLAGPCCVPQNITSLEEQDSVACGAGSVPRDPRGDGRGVGRCHRHRQCHHEQRRQSANTPSDPAALPHLCVPS